MSVPLHKAQDVIESVLRALGLVVFFRAAESIMLHPTGRDMHEKTKKAIRKNRSIAILRGLVQLIPVGGAIYLIILNWNTYYIGVTAHSQALYQTIAKIHKVLIQTSLATVLFAFIRRYLNSRWRSSFRCYIFRSPDFSAVLFVVDGILGRSQYVLSSTTDHHCPPSNRFG